MSAFQSYSQVGQDCFAWGMNGGRPGTFLDIGCGHPATYNNSYGLEKAGWTGVCIDIHKEPAWDDTAYGRKAKLIIGDATHSMLYIEIGNQEFDFLSVDCDENTGLALVAALACVKAKVICAEHDAYLRGPTLRSFIRTFLGSRGYIIVRPNVEWEGKPFEDWFIQTS